MRPAALRVGELAKRTGLSVRALHHYDQIGLLSPARRTEAGYRLYGEAEIARLQQIMSLRQLGFSLEEIRSCLDGDGWSPQRVIDLHLARLREQIAAQQRLYERLEALARGLAAAEEASVEYLLDTIKEMSRVEKYYTPEQQEEIRRRGEALGEEGLRKAEADWAQLIDEVRAEMAKGTDPPSERAQGLAQRWMELVRAFTGGNPEIEKALGRMWQEKTNIHGQDTAEMRRMGEWIDRALPASRKPE